MTDPAQIARGLTKAQRRALLWLPADASYRERQRGDISETPLYCLKSVSIGRGYLKRYITAELAHSKQGCSFDKGSIWPNTAWALTPLGLAVRAELEKKDG